MGASDNFFGSNSDNHMSSSELNSNQTDLLKALGDNAGLNNSNSSSVTSSSSSNPSQSSSTQSGNQSTSSSSSIASKNKALAFLSSDKSSSSNHTSNSSSSNQSSSITKLSSSSSKESSKSTSSSISNADLQQEIMAHQQQEVEQAVQDKQVKNDLDVTPDSQGTNNTDEAQLQQLINSGSSASSSSSNSSLSSASSSQSSGNVANSSSSGYASRRQPLSVTLSNSNDTKSINHILGDVNQKYVKVKPHDTHPLLSNEKIRQDQADVILNPANVFGQGKYDTNYSPKAMFNREFPTKEAKTKYIKRWAKRASKQGKVKYSKVINHLKEISNKLDAETDKQNSKDGQKKQQSRQSGMSRK